MDKTFRQRAQQSTRVLIDGIEVNPGEVEVDFAPYGGTSTEIEIRICKEALIHELSEAGMPVDISNLEDFVKGDVERMPSEAIAGYLGIVRSILSPAESSKVFRLFPKRRVENIVRWVITRIAAVEMIDESLTLRGSVRCLKV